MASNITVSGLVVAPGIQSNFAQWEVSDPNANGLPYRQYDRTELWAATSNDRSAATLVAEGTRSAAYVYGGLQQRYHWIRAKDKEGSVGDWYPASSTAGIVADGVWQNFSPTITPATGAFTDATLVSAKYFRIGPNITFAVSYDIADKGTSTGTLSFTLPATAATGEFPVTGVRTLVGTYSDGVVGFVSGSSGVLYDYAGNPPVISDDTLLRFGGTYEAAA